MHAEALDAEWPDEAALEEWRARTERLGLAAAPHLEALLDEVPHTISAVVCTGDGINLCSVGLYEEGVGPSAALASSVHSVARAAVEVLPEVPRDPELDVVSVQSGDTLLIYITFEHPTLGPLILAAAGRGSSLGELLLESRRTAARVRESVGEL